MAYSQGGTQTKNLIQSRETEVLRRLRALALTESTHSLQGELNFGLGNTDSKPIRDFLEQHAINWIASPVPPLQRVMVGDVMHYHDEDMEESLGCLCISTGLSDSSNHAATNLAALESIFSFFQMSRYLRGEQNPVTSVLFWEYQLKTEGVSSSPARGSEDGVSSAKELPVTDVNPASIWIPDSEVSECQTCLKPFSFLVRKHHCRLCGRVICGECSRFRMVLERTGKSVRVCRSCYYGHMKECRGGYFN